MPAPAALVRSTAIISGESSTPSISMQAPEVEQQPARPAADVEDGLTQLPISSKQ
jgi:hypothetical protein